MADDKVTRALRRRVLGKSGIEVSEIGFGLWAAGGDAWGPTDDGEILDAIDFSLEHGINFFDTSDVYGQGHSEELLGRAMRGRREQFVVATKIGWAGFSDETKSSAYTTVDKLVAGVDTNLRRLNTDYVDVMQSHIDFRDPTMEVFVEGFERLQRQGKLRAYGVSTSDFGYLQAFNADGGCSSLQVDYSILNRTPENDVLPYCLEHDIGVIVRGGLAMGILAGKFDAESRFPETDFRRNWHENEDERRVFLDDLQTVERLRPLAEGGTLAQLALQFTLAHPAVSTVIPGIKNVAQARTNIEAGLLDLAVDGVDAVVPPGGGRKIWPA